MLEKPGSHPYLLEERAWVDASAVELALEGQEILAVVLLERVGARGAGADAQLRGDVLPRLVLGALQMTGEEAF